MMIQSSLNHMIRSFFILINKFKRKEILKMGDKNPNKQLKKKKESPKKSAAAPSIKAQTTPQKKPN